MRKRFLLCLLAIFSLYAKKAPIHRFIEIPEGVQAPWFTGPLLAPSAVTIPPGHINIEPYFFVVANTGRYNHHWKPVKIKTFWNNFFQPLIQFGIVSWMDFQCSPTLFYNYTKGAAKWAIGDMPVGIDFQLYHSRGSITDWMTAVRLTFKETLPIGKYQKLDPAKRGTDVGGGGSWQTAFEIDWGNLFYLGKNHFLTARFNFQYTLPAPVHVKKLNTYGGGPGTKGTVYPAQNFQIDIGTELSLTQTWVFAMDLVGSWSGKTRFKGTTTLSNKAPAAAQFSLAPAIEYNWNANLGVIFGPWFTVAGRNALRFTSGIFALNYYY